MSPVMNMLQVRRKNCGDDEVPHHACKASCLPATSSQIEQFLSMLKNIEGLTVKDARKFIQMANNCTNWTGQIYQMIVNRRNHPRECLEKGSECTSYLLLLRQLAVHYKSCRQVYHLLNSLKVADHFIADFDAALALGDVPYLLKLLAYKPISSSKTFDVERDYTIDNDLTIEQWLNSLDNILLISIRIVLPCQKKNVSRAISW